MIGIYKIENFLISYSSIEAEIYEDEFGYGINFIKNKAKYNIHCNTNVGNWIRLLINDDSGWKDVPFNESTWELLPDSVNIKKII